MFSSKVKVYFYDADPAGIIFYSNLFKYVHVAFEDFIRNLHTERDFFFDKDYTIPIMHAEANYMKPIKVDDELRIDAAVTVLKKSSFEMSYKFYRNENQLVASAKVVHVCIQKEKFEKCELPEEFYQKLKANLV